MASLVSRNGHYSIRLGSGSARRFIGLGKVGTRDAQRFLEKVEELLGLRTLGSAPGPELARWLAAVPDDVHARLAELGLVEPRRVAPPLEQFLAGVIAAAKVKPRTVELLSQTKARLVATFGADAALASITPAAASNWKDSLIEGGLGEATARLHCRNARALFGAAVREEFIARNPFAAVDCASRAGAKVYVSVEDARKVMDELPSVHHRALFALARFAGLRTPSETHALGWADVDLAAKRLRVYSPKAHRFRKGRQKSEAEATRFVPIAPELAEILLAAFHTAAEGAERVVELSTNNLHRDIETAAKRAGLAPWPKTFQALRQSCETDWLDEFPNHVVSAWIGHSVSVQETHYAMVKDDHFQRATGEPGRAANLLHHRAESRGSERKPLPGRRAKIPISADECESVPVGAAASGQADSDYESPALTAELQGPHSVGRRYPAHLMNSRSR